jgi:hypothetical protein
LAAGPRMPWYRTRWHRGGCHNEGTPRPRRARRRAVRRRRLQDRPGTSTSAPARSCTARSSRGNGVRTTPRPRSNGCDSLPWKARKAPTGVVGKAATNVARVAWPFDYSRPGARGVRPCGRARARRPPTKFAPSSPRRRSCQLFDIPAHSPGPMLLTPAPMSSGRRQVGWRGGRRPQRQDPTRRSQRVAEQKPNSAPTCPDLPRRKRPYPHRSMRMRTSTVASTPHSAVAMGQ